MHLRTLIMTIVMAFALMQGAPAQAQQSAFESIISRQIEAFRTGDNDAAFSFAAPALQRLFQTPDNFIAMVKRGYSAVYAPRRFSFPGTEPTRRDVRCNWSRWSTAMAACGRRVTPSSNNPTAAGGSQP